MDEHSFSGKILKKCRDAGVAKAWKINDDFQGGVPDAWFLGKNADIWIEFKWLPALPKRPATVIRPKLSAQQLEWLNTLQEHGKKAYCVLGLPKQAVIFYSNWDEGMNVAQIQERLLTHNELVDWIVEECGV